MSEEKGDRGRRRMLFGRPVAPQVDEYVPGIVLPTVLSPNLPALEEEPEVENAPDPELLRTEEEQRQYEAYVNSGGGLRIFVGNPTVKEEGARNRIPTNVEGLLWDASGLVEAGEEEDEWGEKDDGSGGYGGEFDDELALPAPPFRMPVLRHVGPDGMVQPVEPAGFDADADNREGLDEPDSEDVSEVPIPHFVQPRAVAAQPARPADWLDADDEDLLMAEEAPEAVTPDTIGDAPLEQMRFAVEDEVSYGQNHSPGSYGQYLDSGAFDDPPPPGPAFASAVPPTHAGKPAAEPRPPDPAFAEETTFADLLPAYPVEGEAPEGEEEVLDEEARVKTATDWRALANRALEPSNPPNQRALPAAGSPFRASDFDTSDGWFDGPKASAQPVPAAAVAPPDEAHDPSVDQLDEEADLKRGPATPQAPLTTTSGGRIQWQRRARLRDGGGSSEPTPLDNKVAVGELERTLPTFRTYEPQAEPGVVRSRATPGRIGPVLVAIVGVLLALAIAIGIGAVFLPDLFAGKLGLDSEEPAGPPAPGAPGAVAPPGPVPPPSQPPAEGAADGSLEATPASTQPGSAVPELPPAEPVDPPRGAVPPTSASERIGSDELGMLSVTSNGSGQVFVDGQKVGPSPLQMHMLSAGTHEVRLESNGRSRTAKARVDAGQVTSLRLDF